MKKYPKDIIRIQRIWLVHKNDAPDKSRDFLPRTKRRTKTTGTKFPRNMSKNELPNSGGGLIYFYADL